LFRELDKNEMLFTNGGNRASLWDRVGFYVEDMGQWVGGFCYGLFADCPEEC